ncbi:MULTISPECIES: amidohydrolase [Planococcus]|uniref:Amidohydrolase n=1 Tax=Planococcus faecalis TaxID=1598147 RepID=A0ABN4XU61_9BACL|nr:MULTISPECIES: amidohydrolase [Planococcus]AQU80272.1 amidohydrolase [Planococcus faecalis]MDJ0330436.1 amidohydrolase [Planococcus sp. S3-L1]OHX55098.1 amidohydrolase [Planococcus faecalis]
MNSEQQIVDYFHHFHAHPEVSWREVETTKKLAAIMTELGVKHHTFPDVTGLIAEIGEGPEVIAMRADMDALWQEVDGTLQANHSCGHDANMAMVLGALLYLKDETLTKRVRFIFQPAEELGNGSLSMIERGAIDEVSQLYGVHLRPIEELPFGQVTPALHHGSGIFLRGKIQGVDAHGARPHQGKNAIDVIAAIHQFVKSIYFSPFESYSAKLTHIQTGGDSLNIIPGAAKFALDVRSQSNGLMIELQQKISDGLTAIAKLHDVEITFEWTDYTPAAEVSETAMHIADAAIRQTLGDEATAPPIQTTGADDFHFYTIKKPELHAAMIGIGADLTPGLHHPMMNFNLKALDIGARVLANIAKHK